MSVSPISRERQERLLYEQIDEITEGIAEVQASGGERFTVKQLERTRKSLEARLEKLQAEGRKDDVVTFEQLGVDRLFVDEAHNYKKPVSIHKKCGMWLVFPHRTRRNPPICLPSAVIWMRSPETVA